MNQHTKPVIIATWVGIIVNIFLTILKAVGGILSGSRALIADALHSASDIAGSIVVLLAVKISNKPPDAEHPYGHGKAENIASIIVALLLILVGIEVTLSSAKVFFGDIPQAPGKLALIILFISILIKEILFHYKIRLGRKFKSTALISEAWHHRSDALSSLAALTGVGLALIGEKLDWSFLLYSDAFAGLIVSIIVIKVGYNLIKESANVILEKVLDEAEIQNYEKTVEAIDGVIRIDQLLARTHGSYVVIDIKISVDPNITVEVGHHIGKCVKAELIQKHNEIKDVLVHINPYNNA